MKTKQPLNIEPYYKTKVYLNNCKAKIWFVGDLKILIPSARTSRILNMKWFKEMSSSLKFDRLHNGTLRYETSCITHLDFPLLWHNCY
jgi:hypothetical protein